MTTMPDAAKQSEDPAKPELSSAPERSMRAVDSGGRPSLEDRLEQALEPLVEPSKREAVLKKVELVIAEEHFAGPLPHPDHFERYGEIEPSAPDRILTMAEKEQEFRHSIVHKTLHTDVRSHYVGLAMGWLLTLVLIVGAIYLADKGQVAIPTLLLGAAVLNVVRAFVDASWRKDKHPEPPPKPPARQAPPKNNRRRK